MRIRKLHIVWFWGLLLLMSACGEDDYYYPSVKLEFVTVKAGTDGSIQTLIPDNGEALTVSKDRTGSAISPNTSRRVMSNYETLSNGHTATAVIYSLQSLVTPTPKPADDPTRSCLPEYVLFPGKLDDVLLVLHLKTECFSRV